MLQQSNEMLELVKANFTQTVAILRSELDASNKDKDGFHLEAIRLRRDKAYLEEELLLYQKKCKEDFVESLRGIPNVTKEFLKRIDDLFSKHITFMLTCDKQRNQLEDIRENCSSLSREVENKLQTYLNIVGDQFTKINGENAKYVTQNKRLTEDAQWCNQNRSAMTREHRKTLEQLQLKNDQDSEKLLLENRKLKGDNGMKDKLLSVNENKIQMLTNTIDTLNTSLASCKRTSPFMPNPFGSPNVPNTGLGSTGVNKPNMPWSGAGSSGPAFPSITGTGSSSRWGSTGSGVTGPINTPLGGTGTLSGSSRTGLTQTGSSSFGGAGLGLTGLGSAGSSASTGNTGTGSTAFGTAGSSGVGVGKPATGSFSSVGSNPSGFGAASGGARTAVESQPISQAQINLHLKELLRYSLSN